MKTETNYFEAIVAFTMGIVLSIFTTAYKVYAIMKFVTWFNIPIELNFRQWFGILAVLSLLSYQWTKSEYDKDKSVWSNTFCPLIISVFVTSFLLLIIYIAKSFI